MKGFIVMSIMTTSDVRIKNKESILKFIYKRRCTQQQMICQNLHISRPTLIPLLRELETEGIIMRNGYYESTGGRKANAIVFSENSKIAFGIELRKEAYQITALNLYGEILFSQRYKYTFQNSNIYYQTICQSLLNLIKINLISPEKILGIGIVLQGLISSDGSLVTYGKILDCTGLNITSFTKHLPFPCKFFHDAEAAAQNELWNNHALINGIYINIREHVNGAVIVNREFLKGTELKSGIFEHMTIIPNGRPCYCGRKGCMESYCSTQSLTSIGGTLDNFFKQLRADNPVYLKCWNEYLNFLASSINNLRMFIDYPIILGGTLPTYLLNSDIDMLHRLISEKSAFPTETKFIRISNCNQLTISRGAALPYVQKYLFSITNI